MSKVEEVQINGEIQNGGREEPKKGKETDGSEGRTPQNNQGKTNKQHTTIKKEKDIVQLHRGMGMVWLDRIDPWTISFQRFVHLLLPRLHRPLFVFFVQHRY